MKTSTIPLSFMLALLALVLPGVSLFVFLFSLILSAQLFPLNANCTPSSFLRWLFLVWLIPLAVLLWIATRKFE